MVADPEALTRATTPSSFRLIRSALNKAGLTRVGDGTGRTSHRPAWSTMTTASP